MAVNSKGSHFSTNDDTLLDPDQFTQPNSGTDSAYLQHTATGDKYMTPEELVQQRTEWQKELTKTEDEIQTLRSVLTAKIKVAEDLKGKLGISPIQEFKEDINQGIKNIKESTAYIKSSEALHDIQETITDNAIFQKTSETVKKAGETINETLNPLLSTVSSSMKSKFGEIRNSKAFKSFEDTVGDAYSSVKGKITSTVVTSPNSVAGATISEDPNSPILPNAAGINTKTTTTAHLP